MDDEKHQKEEIPVTLFNILKRIPEVSQLEENPGGGWVFENGGQGGP